MNTQEQNYEYYLKNQDALNKTYPDKYLVIKNKEVIGTYDDQVEAYTVTISENEPGSFIIQKSSPSSTSTQIFHTRVIKA